MNRPSTLMAGPSTLMAGPSTLMAGPSMTNVAGPLMADRSTSMVDPLTLMAGPSTSTAGPSTSMAGPSMTDDGQSMFDQFITMQPDETPRHVDDTGIDPQLIMGRGDQNGANNNLSVPDTDAILQNSQMDAPMRDVPIPDDIEQDHDLQNPQMDTQMGDVPDDVAQDHDLHDLPVDEPMQDAAPQENINIPQGAEIQNLQTDDQMEGIIMADSAVNANGKRPSTDPPAGTESGGRRLPTGKESNKQIGNKRLRAMGVEVVQRGPTKRNIFEARPGDLLADFAKLTTNDDDGASVQSLPIVGNHDRIQVLAEVRGMVCRIPISSGVSARLFTYLATVLFIL